MVLFSGLQDVCMEINFCILVNQFTVLPPAVLPSAIVYRNHKADSRQWCLCAYERKPQCKKKAPS